MKLIFFVIAFILIFLRVYLGWSGTSGNHARTVTITVSDGNNYLQIKYTGTITLTEDETAFKTIAPGGYIRFRKNERKLEAEGNLQGRITYELSEDGRSITDTTAARQFTAAAIREMIAYGFDATPRMERIFRTKGTNGLLQELNQFKNGSVSTQYARRLLETDSLTPGERNEVIDAISTVIPNPEKVPLLNKITAEQLSDSSTADHYFSAIEQLGADIDKIHVLEHLLKSDRLTTRIIEKIQAIADRFAADIDRKTIYQQLQAFQ